MMKLLSMLGLLFFSQILAGQNLVRKAGEGAFAFIQRTLPEATTLSRVFEWSPSASDPDFRILYVAQKTLTRPLPEQTGSFGDQTSVMLLSSADGIHYSERAEYPLGQKNDCWAPIAVDTTLLINIDTDRAKEFCLVLNHEPFCDQFISYVSILFIDDCQAELTTESTAHLQDWSTRFTIQQIPHPRQPKLTKMVKDSLRWRGIWVE